MGTEPESRAPLPVEPLLAGDQPQANPTTRRPGPKQADRIARTTINAPSRVNLGVALVGEDTSRSVQVSASGLASPQMRTTVAGIPGLRVCEAPTYLGEARENIELGWEPRREGPVAGTLDLDFANERPTVSIPVTGKAVGRPQALAALPRGFDVGEQIVGSDHTFDVTLAQLVDQTPMEASITQSIESPRQQEDVPDALRIDMGTRAFKAVVPVGQLGGHARNESVSVRVGFNPYRTGRFRADLLIGAIWKNGEREYREIAITGRARNLRDVPEDHGKETVATEERKPMVQTREPTTTQVAQFEIAAQKARDKAGKLADKQSVGAANAQGVLLGAVEKPTSKPSFFSYLADLAILMGVGGVAQVVSKLITTNVVSVIRNIDPSVAKSTRLVDGLSSAVKDGMKQVAKDAIGKVKEGSAGGDNSSTDLDFFARQRALLTEIMDGNRTLVTNEQERLLPALGDHPAMVMGVFERLAGTFEGTAEDAVTTQTAATVSQWMTGIAREELGTSKASRNGRIVGDTTDLTFATEDWYGGSSKTRGILELFVTASASDLDGAKLERAETRGVSNKAVETLAGIELDELAVPMRLHVSFVKGGGVVITRDELKRILIVGTFPEDSRSGATAQGQLHGRRICDAVLRKSLAAWGVSLTTDMTAARKQNQS